MGTLSVAIPHTFDTRHEGIQAALDVLLARRSEIGQMIADAQSRGDIGAMLDLDVRHAEVCDLASALRLIERRAAA